MSHNRGDRRQPRYRKQVHRWTANSPEPAPPDQGNAWSLPRPEGLNEEAWTAICVGADRLVDAQHRDDLAAVVGSAKELCETVARVILAQRGPTKGANVSFDELLATAHRAIERQPGERLAADGEVRRIAQATRTIVAALRPMRNERGTGHGRAQLPDVVAEHAHVATDAAFLWCRWALRRLESYLDGDVSALVNMLEEQTFRKGVLAKRLVAVDLHALPDGQAHLVGRAVGQRTVRGTFLALREGVCAAIAKPDDWPPLYRAGLITGLLFANDGTLTTSPAAIDVAATLLALHPEPGPLLDDLNRLADDTYWIPPSIQPAPSLDDVLAAIDATSAELPRSIRQSWRSIRTRMTT